jgi:MoxR-like ATPase
MAARRAAELVYCDDRLIRAVIDAAACTREIGKVTVGISPRGPLMLIKAARALALIRKRDYVIDQDILDLSIPVLSHRMVMNSRKNESSDFIRELMLENLDKINY